MLIYKRNGLAYNSSSTQGIVMPKGITQNKLVEKLQEHSNYYEKVIYGDDLKISIIKTIIEYAKLGFPIDIEKRILNRDKMFKHLYTFIFNEQAPDLSAFDEYGTVILRLPQNIYGSTDWEFAKKYLNWLVNMKAVFLSEENCWTASDLKYVQEVEEANLFIDSELSNGGVRYDEVATVRPLPQSTFIWDLIREHKHINLHRLLETCYESRWSEIEHYDQYLVTAGSRVWIFDFSLKEIPTEPVQTYPYLMDLCITKKCDKGCSYCYMDCTPDGEHGGFSSKAYLKLEGWVRNGGHEVILTGGEALLHPHFKTTLEAVYAILSSYNGRVTLTTHDYTAFFGKDFLSYASYLDGVAFSVDSLSDVKILTDMIRAKEKEISDSIQMYNYKRIVGSYKKGYSDKDVTPRLAIQIIPDLWTKEDLLELANSMPHSFLFENQSIVLLGYKQMGRAAEGQVPKKSDEDMQEIFNNFIDAVSFQLYIDTVFAEEYSDFVKQYDGVSLRIKEGVQSCFGVITPGGELEVYPSSMEYAQMGAIEKNRAIVYEDGTRVWTDEEIEKFLQ